MTPRPLALVGALTLAAAAAIGTLAVVTTTEATTERRDFGPVGDRLTIAAGEGALDVRPADVDEVEVVRRLSGRTLLGDRPEAHWDLSDDTGTLSLTTDCGLIGWCDVRYEIRVPRGTAVTVAGGSGAITATGFTAPLEITSDNGAITVADAVAADVRATTENGTIRLAFAAVPEAVTATAENGAVTVELPRATYRVATTTENGDVDVDVPESADSPHTVTVRTENGAIALRTAPAPNGT
ncbi:DUF4097 family beta strand repeat-containing protein [Streptomyces hainanensis]|uniref:DUF4097 domain-containing protein n=1 Tax=Streptomyces hainanensis TaxID=402648 RepID=A0A4R4TV62_9ACTN|nr:DUF4097 family beta strand repeat-containing protein [Streptomyces hainanensis]TDC78019.1 hypothetical protein E1283_05980 [Streptomyces hainanensis]